MPDGRVRGLVVITFVVLSSLLVGADERARVAEWSLDAPTGVTHAVLDNGVVLHHRAAAGQPGRLLVSISLGGGRIEETAANAGVSHAALLAFSEAQEAVRGGDCEIASLADFDALTLTLAGTVEGVSRGMERVAECLRRPRIEQGAFDAWRRRATAQVELLNRSPEYCASRALLQAVSGDDVRVTPVTPRQLERLEAAEAQRWIERLSREAPLEIALIGDVSWDRAKLLIEENFGRLPSRPRDAARLTNLRILARSGGPWEMHLPSPEGAQRSVFLIGFVHEGAGNARQKAAMELAQRIVARRADALRSDDDDVRVRAERQSIPTYGEGGLFICGVSCADTRIAELAERTRSLFETLAAEGPTAAELSAAREELRREGSAAAEDDRAWLRRLRHRVLRQRAEVATVTDTLGEITGEDVRQALAASFRPQRTFAVMVSPPPR